MVRRVEGDTIVIVIEGSDLGFLKDTNASKASGCQRFGSTSVVPVSLRRIGSFTGL